jgi:quinol monooxygenase YgiN
LLTPRARVLLTGFVDAGELFGQALEVGRAVNFVKNSANSLAALVCYSYRVISVVRRFRVREGIETVVQITRAYQRLTRREPGSVRCELWQTSGDPLSFMLLEVFKDAHARTEHTLMPHSRGWLDALGPLLEGTVSEEQAEALVSEPVPPPLPRSQRPAIESSKPFGGALNWLELPKPQPPPSRAARLPQLTIDVEVIEVASARDHIPLRAAQPCVVLGAFVVGQEAAHGVGRTVYRFTPPKRLPGSLVGVQRLLDVPLTHGSFPFTIGIVAVSVEENGGSDVQALYRILADPHDLSFWTSRESCPAPRSMSECGVAESFRNSARRVEVMSQNASLADLLNDDTWAGAALGCFELTTAAPERLARFHTASDDGKNDWLMSLRCRVSR